MSEEQGSESAVSGSQFIKEEEVAEEKEAPKKVSRREFVKGAAAVAGAGALASCAPAATPTTAPGETAAPAPTCPPAAECAPCPTPWLPEKWDKEADVVVVGFGGAGGSAAIAAHDAGAEVLVLEKMPVPGGQTVVSGGVVYGCNTSVQEANGVTDSAAEMYEYYMAVGEGELDPARMRMVSEKSGETIEWLIGLGVEFPTLYLSGAEASFADLTPPKPRGHSAGGAALFGTLGDEVEARGIEVLVETPATKLIADPRRQVLGVVADSAEKELNIKARKGVILASGSFGSNQEMIKLYGPDLRGAVSYAVPGLTGDGILMAEALGANLDNIGHAFRVQPVIKTSPGFGGMILPLFEHTCVLVNEAGKRFVDEGIFYEYLTKALLEQEGRHAYAIFDEDVKKLGGTAVGYFLSKDLSSEIEAGSIKKADTISELAALVGLDPATLEETVNKVNQYAAQGTDPEFGRETGLGAVQTPPFYCIEALPGVGVTAGGLKTTVDAKVTDVFGEVIPRLYGAGDTIGGWCFEMYPGSGTAILNGILFGRLAGENAAAQEPWE